MKITSKVGSLLGLIIWVGWFMNLMSLVSAGALATWGGMEIARVVGVVVFPLGGLLGWF